MFRLICLCAALWLVGCSARLPDTPTAQTPALTPAARGTLPPTWTPSNTPTPRPSRTPTTTPSVTPTLSARAICEGFAILHDFSAQTAYPWGGYIPLLIRLDSPEAQIVFTATHRSSGEGAGFELPGGQTIVMEFLISALPHPGTYDWTLGVRSAAYGDICQSSGTFIALRPTPTPRAVDTVESTRDVHAAP